MTDDLQRQTMLENLKTRFFEDVWMLCVELVRYMTDQEMKRVYNIICMQQHFPIETQFRYIEEPEKEPEENKLKDFLETCKSILTPAMVAEALGVSGKTIIRVIKKGKLISMKSPSGKNYWITKTNVKDYFTEEGYLN